MTIHEALYKSIKEAMPDDLYIVFNNLNENIEQCGLCFKGGQSPEIRFIDGRIGNRRLNLVINYNMKDTFKGYDYGNRVIESLIKIRDIGYRDDETGELLVYISKIIVLGDVNFLKKNVNNGLNCFSLNFMITYGKI